MATAINNITEMVSILTLEGNISVKNPLHHVLHAPQIAVVVSVTINKPVDSLWDIAEALPN